MRSFRRGLFLVLTAVANCSYAAAPSDEIVADCTKVSEMARGIMSARQEETAMAKMMAIKTGDKHTDDLGAMLVQDAYQKSSYSTAEYKQKAIRQFENKWFAACLESRTK